jgi:hypothetical protein
MFAAKDTQLTRPSGGFFIPRSLRFRRSATAYLDRTVSTTGDRQKATWSGWVKRGLLTPGDACGLLVGDDGAGSRDFIRLNSVDKLAISLNENTSANLVTAQVFRDPSAWYHFVIAIDTTQATAANRIKLYVNGAQVTAFTTETYPSQNANFVAWNVSGKVQNIGCSSVGGSQLFDGYMAEVNWIDGQQLTPTSFGTTSTITGVWSPKKYGGTYGNNGFHLDFNSYATAAALGTDTSGNSNTWTVNNCSVTAGVTYDSMIDVPTVTDTGSNYAVLNPLNPTGCTVTAGNLTSAGTVVAGSRSSMTMSAGKWYWEVTVTAGASADLIGLVPVTTPYDTDFSVAGSFGIGYYATSLQSLWINGVNTASYGASYTTNDVIGIKIDVTNNTVEFLKNNTSQGVINTTLLGKDWVAVHGNRSPQANTKDFNFGQRPFAYTPPTGFNSLNTYNLAAPSILKGNKYMDATTYTGTGASLGVTNAGGFQPDWVWIKSRSAAGTHSLYDVNRGVRVGLFTNVSSAESTEAAGFSMTAFNSNGFTVGLENAGSGSVNDNGTTYVGWQWKAGSTVTNTSGSVSAQVSASAASGFSVVTYTGTGANATVGHGLGVAPRMMIIKQRSGGASSGANDWNVYHASLTSAVYYIRLNLTNAEVSNATVWNSTAPSSTVFSLGSQQNSNELNGLMVAYCFAPIAGYSAFGSYVANNSTDGPFVYLGFRPRFIMFKDISGAADWEILDTTRSPYNLATAELKPNTAGAETTATSIDYLSNGFKLRAGAADPNNLTHTYIYAAFAENPFNNSLAR